jgi:hypothetical protein
MKELLLKFEDLEKLEAEKRRNLELELENKLLRRENDLEDRREE